MPRFESHPARRPTIVAGASTGIGAATAVELAARGFPVALGARRIDRCAALVERINAAGGEAIAVALDITVPESVENFVAKAVEALGEIDLVVSTAGQLAFGRLQELNSETFAEQIGMHLTGAYRVARAVLPGMLHRQRGDLIFVGSEVALRPKPYMGAYGAAKAGLNSMVSTLQMELEGSGVRASMIHPGATDTDMLLGHPDAIIEEMVTEWGRWGHARHGYLLRASDLARAIAFAAETPRGGYVASMEIQPQVPPMRPADSND